ncbi:MAG: GNAT family N-acetyltransferase, partial [Desulfocapsaceae bacterium]
VWDEQTLLCCGALKELTAQHAELKSMRTTPAHLGKGLASVLLRHILSEARKRNYKRLSLETGSYEAFVPARKLYEKFGFSYCGPFSDYTDNSNSVFMTIQL